MDAILAVGFPVRSSRGTQFRRWATERLREYLVKGFTMDDERRKNPPVDGRGVPDYFDKLLERIRDIRSSERRVYLRVREIFALAADYQASATGTTAFFQGDPEQAPLRCHRQDSRRAYPRKCRWIPTRHGSHNLEGEIVRTGDVTTAKLTWSIRQLPGWNKRGRLPVWTQR